MLFRPDTDTIARPRLAAVQHTSTSWSSTMATSSQMLPPMRTLTCENSVPKLSPATRTANKAPSIPARKWPAPQEDHRGASKATAGRLPRPARTRVTYAAVGFGVTSGHTLCRCGAQRRYKGDDSYVTTSWNVARLRCPASHCRTRPVACVGHAPCSHLRKNAPVGRVPPHHGERRGPIRRRLTRRQRQLVSAIRSRQRNNEPLVQA